MRARASTKTQRRLKQMQLHDPYELTDDVYDAAMKTQAQTLRVGGLVTAAGALQAVAAVVVGGYAFGPAMLFCALLLVALGALGYAHLGKAAGGRKIHRRGVASRVSETLGHLRALQRGALDYSLTLSIADSAPIRDKAGRASRAVRRSAERALTREKEPQWRLQEQLAVVPTRPTPQKVVAAMYMTMPPSPVTSPAPFASTLKPQKTTKQETRRLQHMRPKSTSEPQPKSAAPLARDAPIVTLNKVVMSPLKVPDALQRQKPKQQKLKEQVKRQHKLQPKKQQEKKPGSPQQPLPVLQQSKPKAQLEPQQTSREPVRVEQEQQPVQPDVMSAAPLCVEPVKPVGPVVQTSLLSLPVFPAPTPIAEVARAEPVPERDVISTRRVLLYLSPSVVTPQEAEENVEQEQEDWEPAMAAVNVLGEEWPALTASVSTRSLPLPPSRSEAPVGDVEPNFLLDIALEATSTPAEAKPAGVSPLEPVGNAELRTMLTELDQMRLELDAAMASCTAALAGEPDQVTVSPLQPELELEPEVEIESSC